MKTVWKWLDRLYIYINIWPVLGCGGLAERVRMYKTSTKGHWYVCSMRHGAEALGNSSMVTLWNWRPPGDSSERWDMILLSFNPDTSQPTMQRMLAVPLTCVSSCQDWEQNGGRCCFTKRVWIEGGRLKITETNPSNQTRFNGMYLSNTFLPFQAHLKE